MIKNAELDALARPGTPLADSYLRARYGLPHDFDLGSVPFAHLEYIGAEIQRETLAQKKKEAAQALETKPLMAASAPAPPPSGTERRVTWDALKEVVSQITGALREKFEAGALALKSLQTRMFAIEARVGKLTDSAADVETLSQRISKVEVQTGALSQLLVGNNDAKAKLAAIESLTSRIVELEARPTLAYRGVWAANTDYVEGNCVTHSGSLWTCIAATSAKPGSGGGGWQLCVKKGNDGKDAR